MRRAKGSLHVATCTRNKIRVKAGHLFSPSSSLEARLILRWGVFVQRGAKLVIGSLEPNRSTIWKLRRILVLVRGGRGGGNYWSNAIVASCLSVIVKEVCSIGGTI